MSSWTKCNFLTTNRDFIYQNFRIYSRKSFEQSLKITLILLLFKELNFIKAFTFYFVFQNYAEEMDSHSVSHFLKQFISRSKF